MLSDKFIQIYISNVCNIQISRDLAFADRSRAEKLLRYHFDRDKQLSLGACMLLQYAAKKQGFPNAHYYLGEHGKPLSDQFYFNISHSYPYAAVIISNEPCGIDVEKMEKDTAALAKHFFAAAEYEHCLHNPDSFCDFWTLKESFLKLQGTGLSGGLDSIDFSQELGKSAFQKLICGTEFYFSLSSLPDGYRLATASMQPCDAATTLSVEQLRAFLSDSTTSSC